MTRADLIARLAAGGFVAPDEEADELLAATARGGGARHGEAAAGADGAHHGEAAARGGGADDDHGEAATLEALVRRRETGEPLAWITGRTTFCGLDLIVHPGVYVPRWHTELLAERAAALRPAVAIDLCTGCGAIAAVLAARGAKVVASDVSAAAVANARANGVDAHEGDLFEPLNQGAKPPDSADVITAVVPYVPTPELPLLQRDTLAHETPLAYDGGDDGLAIVRRVVTEAPRWLTPGGTLILELGGDQADRIPAFGPVERIVDDDGDVRGVAITLPA